MIGAINDPSIYIAMSVIAIEAYLLDYRSAGAFGMLIHVLKGGTLKWI